VSKAKQVLAGYHAYGYWVEASVEGGHVVKREDYGNSPYESTSVFPLKEGKTVSLEKLRECAARSANALAEELGVKPKQVSVFHDTDCEEGLREELNDVEVAA
jgi:hypothetical protein